MRATRRSWCASAALALVLVLAGSACRAEAKVDITVKRDGSGTVEVGVALDADAVGRLGDDLDTALKLDDVTASGWKVDRSSTKSGGELVTATKQFARPGELQSVLSEVGGDDGSRLFQGWKLTVDDGFTSTNYRLDGIVNLTGSLDQFSDADVAAALDGFATGRSPEELTAAIAEDPDALTLAVSVAMPAEIDDLAGLAAKDLPNTVAGVGFALGNGEASRTQVSVNATSTDRTPALFMVAGATCLVVGAVLFVIRRRRPGRGRGSRSSAARAASRAPSPRSSGAPMNESADERDFPVA